MRKIPKGLFSHRLVIKDLFNVDSGSINKQEGLSCEEEQVGNLWNLSPRERDVASLLCKGKSYKEVAEILHISLSTVQSHIKNVYRKIDVNTKESLILKLKIWNMIEKVALTDPGNSLLTYITDVWGQDYHDMGIPFFESGIKYNSEDASDLTITATTISGMMGDDVVSYTLSGTTLTITAPDDNDTPADETDDSIMVIVTEKRDASFIEGAEDDTTILPPSENLEFKEAG